MTDHNEPDQHDAHPHYHQAMNQVKDHKFIVLIVGSLGITMFLLFAAMSLYNSSGAAQLDLSRPGYEDIREKLQTEDTTISYGSSGPLNKETLDEFQKKYEKKLAEAKESDAFEVDVLSQKSLQIDQETAAASAQ